MSLIVFKILERSNILLCNFSFLRSKNLYSSLKSSLTSWSVFTSNGNTFLHLPNTSILLALTSISPVDILGFLLALSTTFPSICIQLSVVKAFAFSSRSLFSLLIKICVIPNSSLKSMNNIPPRSLIF